MTGDQLWEARYLLRWSGKALASRSGIAAYIILSYERTNRMMKPSNGMFPVDRIGHLQAILEAAGIEFTIGNVPGVKLRKVEA